MISNKCTYKVNWRFLKRHNIQKYRQINNILQLEFLTNDKKKSIPLVINLFSNELIDSILFSMKFTIEHARKQEIIVKIMRNQIDFLNIILESKNEPKINNFLKNNKSKNKTKKRGKK